MSTKNNRIVRISKLHYSTQEIFHFEYYWNGCMFQMANLWRIYLLDVTINMATRQFHLKVDQNLAPIYTERHKVNNLEPVLTLGTIVVWDVKPFRLQGIYQRFSTIWRLHFLSSGFLSCLDDGGSTFLGNVETIQQSTWRHIPQKRNLNFHQ